MATVFITGSSTGLGALAGEKLRAAGHVTVLHARSQSRAAELSATLPDVPLVIGDLSDVAGMTSVAEQVNRFGPMDAVIHNAGIYLVPHQLTAEGIPATFAVNVLAPYVLTAGIAARRLVYLSSGMHQVRPVATDPLWRERRWNATQAYSESKYYVTALAMAVARLRPDAFSNAVDPGWVPTRMGGSGAPDDLDAGAQTQVELAASGEGALARLSGQYLYHRATRDPAVGTRSVEVQARLLSLCEQVSGIALG